MAESERDVELIYTERERERGVGRLLQMAQAAEDRAVCQRW